MDARRLEGKPPYSLQLLIYIRRGRLWLVEKFPEAGEEQKGAEEFFQEGHVDLKAQPGEKSGGQSAGENGGEDLSDLHSALLIAEKKGNGGCGEEKQKVDAPGGDGVCIQDKGEPEDQKAPSADAETG